MRKLLAALFALCLPAGAYAQQINGGGGAGGGGGSGTVTSIATTCGVSGGTITTSGTVRAAESVSPQTGANYAFQDSDCGKLINLSNGSNQAPTLAAANSGSLLFATGGFVDVCNQGAGTQTLTPTTSTIGGASTYVLAAGSAAAPKCVTVVSDGTNYQVIPYSGSTTTFANPSATASDVANNGVATTAMRSDASPAVQKATNSQFGLVEPDTSFNLSGGVLTARQTAPVYIANNWYVAGSEHAITSSTNAASTSGAILCYPEYFHGPATISALGSNVGTANAGSNVQLAIYAHNATTFRPTGNALVSTSNISTASTGVISSAVSLAITNNTLLWWCVNGDGSTQHLNGHTSFFMSAVGGTATQLNAMNGSVRLTGVQVSQTFGTWPDLTAASFTELSSSSILPSVEFKIGSVP